MRKLKNGAAREKGSVWFDRLGISVKDERIWKLSVLNGVRPGLLGPLAGATVTVVGTFQPSVYLTLADGTVYKHTSGMMAGPARAQAAEFNLMAQAAEPGGRRG